MSKLVILHYKYFKDTSDWFNVMYDFKNNTDKTIKYATFWVTPYNAVNDPVECSITGISTTGITFTGPVEPGKDIYRTKKVWYNHEIRGIHLSTVDIVYMDGTAETLNCNEIEVLESSHPKSGCYVATCVYGSYDCPQVWTLRRFRDNTMAETWWGRAFIRTYYAISPTLVKWFGKTAWFKNLWKPMLERMVKRLNASGVEDTPYKDIQW